MAAEVSKYGMQLSIHGLTKVVLGKSVLSDPRRSARFLVALEALRQEAKESLLEGDQGSDYPLTLALSKLPLPETSQDRDALLRWAYFEANAIIRQYGDLLEELRAYLETGTSSVGECVLLVEDTLT